MWTMPTRQQVQTSHLESQLGFTIRVLELVHMDLMGPMQVESIARIMYVYVCVDDFSRFTWVNFLRTKSEAFEALRNYGKDCQHTLKD